MSSRDLHHEDDARLAAFLNKEDGLAKLLQEIEQPTPSAALDAAILAQAEAAMRAEEASVAANDPEFPGAVHRSPRPFLPRWKLPLSVAAAALLTLSVVVSMRQSAGPDTAASIQLAQAPASPAAAPAPAAEESVRATNGESAGGMAAEQKKESAPKQRTARKAMQLEKSTTERSVQLAQELAAAEQAEMTQRKALRSMPDVLAKADVPEAGTVWRGAPPKVAPAPAPAPAQAAGDLSEEKMPGVNANLTPAKEWLKQIERKIHGGQLQEALDEWGKFRKAYPDYEVPVQLREKMEELKK